MTSRALHEAFHREFMTFFERAERTRRWNVFTDIAWDRLAGPAQMADPRLVRCAETFCGVEMYLPDYLRAHLDLMRGDYGRAWFAANWGYEEAKHSLALREYLRRSGARDERELHDYAETVLARSWRAPYGDGRRDDHLRSDTGADHVCHLPEAAQVGRTARGSGAPRDLPADRTGRDGTCAVLPANGRAPPG